MQLTRTCRGPSLPTGLLLAGAIGAVVISGSASGTPPGDPDPGRFEKAIQHFEAWDRKNAIPDAPVLFVGSSSIRMWPTQSSFPRLPVIN
ncbi:MAG: hypothetical protein GY842_07090, partial [bacterium]|nr:hypothetical protein [bacterium]